MHVKEEDVVMTLLNTLPLPHDDKFYQLDMNVKKGAEINYSTQFDGTCIPWSFGIRVWGILMQKV